MKKEQLKECIGELNLVVTEFEADGMCYMDGAVNVTQVYDLIDQLEEPKRVVIPRFVADWIDAHDLHGNNPLREYRDLEIDFNEGWTNEKDAAVYHWVNENPYAFIDALRYSYEVEKEKLYQVIIPTKDTVWKYYYLDHDGGIDMESNLKYVHLHTEAFIRSVSDDLWPFAVEVEK